MTWPILIHAIPETAQGVTNVEDIAAASPPTGWHELLDRPTLPPPLPRMKTTCGGGHRATARWRTRTAGNPRFGCHRPAGIRAITRSPCMGRCPGQPRHPPRSTAHLVTSRTRRLAETQFRFGLLLGCVGAWVSPPWSRSRSRSSRSSCCRSMIDLSKKVTEAIPDGAFRCDRRQDGG